MKCLKQATAEMFNHPLSNVCDAMLNALNATLFFVDDKNMGKAMAPVNTKACNG